MNPNRDRLDEVIDVVAARMTNVDEDAALAARIANALPERSAWLPYGWLPRLAMGALATIAIIVVLRSFDDGSTDVGPAKAGLHNASVTPAQNDIVSVAPVRNLQPHVARRRVGVESAFRRTNSEATESSKSDHERSLVAVAAPDALTLGSLSPIALPEDAPLTVESLEIADLPLTGDFSPRR